MPALARKPRLLPYLHGAWEAFCVLSASRPSGGMGGPSSIPLSEIRAYCDLFQITGQEEVYELVIHIQAMDRAYLDFAARHRPQSD